MRRRFLVAVAVLAVAAGWAWPGPVPVAEIKAASRDGSLPHGGYAYFNQECDADEYLRLRGYTRGREGLCGRHDRACVVSHFGRTTARLRCGGLVAILEPGRVRESKAAFWGLWNREVRPTIGYRFPPPAVAVHLPEGLRLWVVEAAALVGGVAVWLRRHRSRGRASSLESLNRD